jgi:hypothetical protein
MSNQWVTNQLQKQHREMDELYNKFVTSSKLPIYMIVDRKNGQPRDKFHLIKIKDNVYKRYFLDLEGSTKMEWDLSWHPDTIAEFLSSGWWIPMEPISYKDYLLNWKIPSPRAILSSNC